MTAEVVILNCSGVALAADSAVTVGSQKIYNSAMKLFALSKVAPVAIMVYGNATLSHVPWEVVIKEYRRNLKNKTFAQVNGYAEDFVRFISTSKYLFNKNTEQAWVSERVNSLLVGIFKEATKICENEIEASKGKGINAERVEGIFVEVTKNQVKAIKSWGDLKPNKAVVTRINKLCKDLTDQIGAQVFGKIYKKISRSLLTATQQAFRRNWFPGPSSGIVISGYGEEEIFPSVITLEFDGAVAGFARYKVDGSRTQCVSAGENSAAIIAYAQEDMVATFMEGINPAVKKFLEENLKSLFDVFPDALMKSLGLSDKKTKDVLVAVCANVRNNISNVAHKYRFQEHVMPVLSMVNALPKDELAAMAESLVNLTAFKRRVTGTLETVGGPIDVCVISKGDGLVWVKRKHYFPSELNPLFHQNYMRELR